MQAKSLARAGAVAFVAVAITAAAIQMRDGPSRPSAAAMPAPEANRDPLRAELVRCQALGQDGASDAACLRAWDANRRRFFGLAGPATAEGANERPSSESASPTGGQSNEDPVAKASAPAPAGGH